MSRKKAAPQKMLSPHEARRTRDAIRLQRDNVDTRHGWILLDGGSVVIAQQQDGQPATAMVTLPRREFARLARWYFRPQRLRVRGEDE